ncbi:14181_t:CDS:1, partial [Racocetra persica]
TALEFPSPLLDGFEDEFESRLLDNPIPPSCNMQLLTLVELIPIYIEDI